MKLLLTAMIVDVIFPEKTLSWYTKGSS